MPKTAFFQLVKMHKPQKAMVLAAGLGTRMRPITQSMPKPLVKTGGKTLLDWCLDALNKANINDAVVNVHYLADQIEAHVQPRFEPRITISDEREKLLDSAGGIINALPMLGSEPFYILNADTFWVEDGDVLNLNALAEQWDDSRMDILLMVAQPEQTTGYEGKKGDFVLDDAMRIQRYHDGMDNPVIYAGAGIIHPRIFNGAKAEPASLNDYFNKAIAEKRLYAMPMQGHWLTVGTPEAILEAEYALKKWQRER